MSEAEAPQFEEDLLKERSDGEQLLLFLGSFDGPIDMLLALARDQKVDLTKISILALATQYLDFVEKARSLRLELAADYLVMAAWLAYLKSRLLIPADEQKQAEPTAQDLAEALQFQLRRLEAMRKTADMLFHLPRLGFNIFARGEPDGLPTAYISKYDMTYYDLLKAYGDIKLRQQNSVYKLNPVKLFALEESIARLESMLGKIPLEWVSLFMFLPGGITEKIVKRSAVASTFGGALELVKRGQLQLQQDKNFAPIFIRRPANHPAALAAIAAAQVAVPKEESLDMSERHPDDVAAEAAEIAAEHAAANAGPPADEDVTEGHVEHVEHSEAVIAEETHVDDVSVEEAHSEEAHSEEAHSEEAHSEEAHSEEAHSEEAHSEEAHSEEAHSEEAHSEEAGTTEEHVTEHETE